MAKKSGGQLPPHPNRRTGAPVVTSKKFGQVTPRGTGGGFGVGTSHGQTHITKGGAAQGGSGSARSRGFGKGRGR